MEKNAMNILNDKDMKGKVIYKFGSLLCFRNFLAVVPIQSNLPRDVYRLHVFLFNVGKL